MFFFVYTAANNVTDDPSSQKIRKQTFLLYLSHTAIWLKEIVPNPKTLKDNMKTVILSLRPNMRMCTFKYTTIHQV